MKCVDMHFHTSHSDGAATVDETLTKVKEDKIGVSITDHNEISGYIEANDKDKDAFIIPGIEVKSEESVDILFYFYTRKELVDFYEKEIKHKKRRYFHSSITDIPLKQLYKLSTKYKCITCVAHPFGYSLRSAKRHVFEKNEPVLKKFEIFEAINGGNSKRANMLAAQYIAKHSKKICAGSDGHSIYRLGKVLTCADAKNINQFLDHIKSGKVKISGSGPALGKLSEYTYFSINKIKNIFA
jgi:predicted metal-dependent phosphoesterase TrpH